MAKKRRSRTRASYWAALLSSAAFAAAAAPQARAAGPDTFRCVPSDYDATIEAGAYHPQVSVANNVATIDVSKGQLVGDQDLAAITAPKIVVNATGGKGLLVDNLVGSSGALLRQAGQELELHSSGEVVLGGAIVLNPDQTLDVVALGLEAIDCQAIPNQGNGAHVVSGGLHLDIRAAGIGAASSPHGQVTTRLVSRLRMHTALGARVCLNMRNDGDSSTLQLEQMSLGGQTGIRLDTQPVSTVGGIRLRGAGASLLIGPNASLCY